MLPLDGVTQQRVSKRMVIATIGSLGDLYPCLALATGLRRMGHRVTFASTPYYRPRVESLGINFQPIRPDWDPTDPHLIRQCEDLKKGPEVLYRKMLLPELRSTYEDLMLVARDADLLITGELVYAAPLVADKLSLRWVSMTLSPFSFFSSFDPSVMVNAPRLIHLRKFGPTAYRLGLNIGRLATRHWSNPVRKIRRDEGLQTDCDPVFRDKFSPYLVLALFSNCLAEPQPDWPSQTVQTGFVFFENQTGETNLAMRIAEFLSAGDPPIIFTQGSTAVHNAGDFYEVSVAAANRLQRRAILIGNKASPEVGSSNILNIAYATYSQVFPHAAVIVHQGGSGTTGEALRAGRPMLVVPYGWDQPDNARRIQRLGAGLHVARSNYTLGTATRALAELLTGTHFANAAAEAQTRLRGENGLSSACAAIESVLNAKRGAMRVDN